MGRQGRQAGTYGYTGWPMEPSPVSLVIIVQYNRVLRPALAIAGGACGFLEVTWMHTCFPSSGRPEEVRHGRFVLRIAATRGDARCVFVV